MSDLSSKDLELISFKLDQMQEKQLEASQTIKDIHKSLVDPKDGLFSQVTDLRRWAREHEKSDGEMREQIGEITKLIHPIVRKTETIELWAEEHEERDRELRESVVKISKSMEPLTDDYKLRASRKKWTDRILWFLIAGLLTGLISTIKYVFFDVAKDHQRLDNIEQMLQEKNKS